MFNLWKRLAGIGLMVMVMAASGWGDGSSNDSCNGEQISELHGISATTSRTESGTLYDGPGPDDDDDYYYFKPGIAGTLSVNAYSATQSTDLYIATTGCGDNRVLNNGTAYSTGTPISISSTDTVYIRIKREQNNATTSYSLPLTFTAAVVAQTPPVMGTIPNQNGTVGTVLTPLNLASYVTLTNGDPITAYTLSGSLPAGLSFNTSTGVISGTPTAAGTYDLSATATDDDGVSNASSFSIVVAPPPSADLSITKNANTTLPRVGDLVTFTIVGTNNGSLSSQMTISDTLPSGLTWVSDSENSGAFSCSNAGNTVTCTGSNNFSTGSSVTVTIVARVVSTGTIVNTATITSANGVNDGNTTNNSASVTLNVYSPPAMGNIPDQSGVKNTPFSLAMAGYVTPTDGDPITLYALNGTLPAGLSFNSTTGVLSGTPTQTGTFSFTATATDKDGVSNSDAFTLIIASAPTGTVPELPADNMCSLFPTPLTTFDHLTLQNNGVYESCTISYPVGQFTDSSVGNNPHSGCHSTTGAGCNCSRVNPVSTFTAPLYITNLTNTVNISDTTLSDLNQPNLNLSGTITFSPSASYGNDARKVMLIGDINNVNVDTMTFNEGDYYIKSWTISGNGNNKNNIVINGNVRIFVQGDFTNPGNNVDISYADNASTFFMYVGGNMTTASNGGGNAQWKGFYYVKGNYRNDNNAMAAGLDGGITAEGTITFTGQNYNVTYDADRAGRLGGMDCSAFVTVGFDKPDYQTTEDLSITFGTSSTMLMNIVLSHAVNYDVSVAYATQDGTAVAGQDYIAQSATVTIPSGQTSVTVPMYIIHDQPIELDETFQVVLTNPQPSGTVNLGINPATVTILEQTTAPLCYADNFDQALDSKWRTLFSSGGYTPDVSSGHLKLTPGKMNISTAVTKDYEFASKQNLIIIEFEHYAYGGCFEESPAEVGLGDYGADGIVAVLYDTSVGANPLPGGYGGSMGYAQRTGVDGFQGGWLGLGLDEYGNFSNPTEGRVGGTGFHPNTAVIRGDGSGTNGYEFLAEAYPLSSPIAPLVDITNPAKLPGDKYRMTVDARDPLHLYITLQRDLNDGNGYQVVINKFDAKDPAYNQSNTPDFVRFALTGGTGGGCNAHEIDNLAVYGNCTPYVPTLSGQFRVTEDNSTASWAVKWPKKLINTQVAPVNKRFCVLAGTNGTDSAQPLTNAINVDVNMTDNNGYNQEVKKNLNIPAGGSQACFDVNYANAGKLMQFIVTKNGTGTMKSYSDTFAIRPNTFIIDTNSTTAQLFAGQTYRLDTNATSLASNYGVPGYTTTIGTLGSTSALQTLVPAMATCPANGTVPMTLLFTNGQSSLSNFFFDNVMDINVSVVDGNWTETDQANGGCIPGSDSTTSTPVGCLIKGSKMLSFTPHHFDLAANLHNYNNGPFSYLSNPTLVGSDFNMSAGLDLNITARTALNNTATNYYAECYAKTKDINITYTPTAITNLTNLWYQVGYDAVTQPGDHLAIGNSIYLPAYATTMFTAAHPGSAQMHFKFNFDRNNAQPVSPFIFDITQIDVNNTNEVNATIDPANSAIFFYGRADAPEYRFANRSSNNDVMQGCGRIYFEFYNAVANNPAVTAVFGTTPPMSLSPDRDWFQNILHNPSTDGNVTAINANGITVYGHNVNQNNACMGSMSGPGFEKRVFEYDGATAHGGFGYPYKSTANLNTSDWLDVPGNNFGVELYKTGTWIGEQKAKRSTDQNAELNTNRRVTW